LCVHTHIHIFFLSFASLSSIPKAVGVSYVVTKLATAPESLLVYYTITDKSASARTPL
jgi:hypothetical protein